MSVVRLMAWCLLLALLSGCAAWRGTGRTVRYGGAKVALQAPGSFAAEKVFVQRVSGRYEGKEFLYNLQVEVDAEQVVMAGFTAVGFRAFVMTWDGVRLDYDARWGVKIALPPNQLFAAWQLAMSPEVKRFDLPESLAFEGNPPEVRRLTQGDVALVTVMFCGPQSWEAETHFEASEPAFTMAVQTMDVEELEE